MIPAPAAVMIIHDLKHSPLEQAYTVAAAKIASDHARDVSLGIIGLPLRLFVRAAVIANKDATFGLNESVAEVHLALLENAVVIEKVGDGYRSTPIGIAYLKNFEEFASEPSEDHADWANTQRP